MFARTIVLVVVLMMLTACHAGTYYISPDGSDTRGDGSAARPWATIRHATNSVGDDGSTIVCRDGLYVGAQALQRHFTKPVRVKAEHPYRARFRSAPGSNRAFHCYEGSNASFEGLEFFGSGAAEREYLMHISTKNTHHLTFVDCIIHDSYKNDLVKINDQSHDIVFRGCLLFNIPDPGDEIFDINVVHDVVVEDCILMSDLEGSGRKNENRNQALIVIKNSSKDEANKEKTRRIAVRRNVFCNWEGRPGESYVLVGEDEKDFWEAQDVTIENNLFLFNSANRSTGAVTLKCHVRNIVIRANTVSGTVFGWTCYALRCSQEKAQLAMENIYVCNNIFSDPSGRMPQLIWGRREFVRGERVLLNNLYWNGGRRFVHHDTTLFRIPDDDPAGIAADPKLPHPEKMVIPRWNADKGRFASGEATIRAEFERLVATYAKLPPGSPAIGKADAKHMPDDDILGRPRGDHPDIGAYQTRPASTGVDASTGRGNTR